MQYVPANKDGSCPAGSHEAGGSSGNAGQPGTGSVNCRLEHQLQAVLQPRNMCLQIKMEAVQQDLMKQVEAPVMLVSQELDLLVVV